MAVTNTELNLFGPAAYALDPASWDPTGVRGADKVAQRLIYALFTPLGSVPGLTTSGSTFLDLARGFRSEFDLFAAFAAAYDSAVAAVKAAEYDGEPDSEKFGRARLESAAVDADKVTLTLGVVAADGSTPTGPVKVPLDV